MSVTFRKASAFLVSAVAAWLPASLNAQTSGSGFGADITGTPMGKPFTLPAGLEVGGPLVGDSLGGCPDGSKFAEPGRSVEVCLPLCNRTEQSISAQFPPGLIIRSRSEGYQNGLLIEDTVVEVPPNNCQTPDAPLVEEEGDQKKLPDQDLPLLAPAGAVWVPLSAYCLNEDATPSNKDGRYVLGPVTTDPKMLPVLNIVKNRKVTTKQDVRAIQNMIYSVTDRDRVGPLRPEVKAHVMKLPRKG